jgi:hypothetical protein
VEQQLDRVSVFLPCERAGQLQQERGARSAVARADEAELAEQLRVVVAGDDEAVAAGPGDRGDQVDEPDLADRRVVVLPRLVGDRDARRLELAAEVGARLLDAGRAGRTGTDRDELPQVLPRAVRVERRLGAPGSETVRQHHHEAERPEHARSASHQSPNPAAPPESQIPNHFRRLAGT